MTALERVRRRRTAVRRKRDQVLDWLVTHQARRCLRDCPFYHPLPD